MSNRKENQGINEYLRIKRKMMLQQLKKEILDLEYDINHSKYTNLKVSALRNLKIALCTGKLAIPYILTASTTFILMSLFVSTPFIKDKQKKELQIKKEIDSLNNIHYEQQYEDFENYNGTISYFGKWIKQQDDLYSRKVEVYDTGKVDENIVTEIVNNYDITSLDDIFGNAISSKVEIKNNLTEEEIKNPPYLQATIYSKSKDTFIIAKESVSDNFLTTLAWLMLTVIAEGIVLSVKKEYNSFNYDEEIEAIKEKYPTVDIEELRKRLEIKQDNYNRLTR